MRPSRPSPPLTRRSKPYQDRAAKDKEWVAHPIRSTADPPRRYEDECKAAGIDPKAKKAKAVRRAVDGPSLTSAQEKTEKKAPKKSSSQSPDRTADALQRRRVRIRASPRPC